MIVRIWEVKRVACYARAETFTEAVASMVAMHLPKYIHTVYNRDSMRSFLSNTNPLQSFAKGDQKQSWLKLLQSCVLLKLPDYIVLSRVAT